MVDFVSNSGRILSTSKIAECAYHIYEVRTTANIEGTAERDWQLAESMLLIGIDPMNLTSEEKYGTARRFVLIEQLPEENLYTEEEIKHAGKDMTLVEAVAESPVKGTNQFMGDE